MYVRNNIETLPTECKKKYNNVNVRFYEQNEKKGDFIVTYFPTRFINRLYLGKIVLVVVVFTIPVETLLTTIHFYFVCLLCV